MKTNLNIIFLIITALQAVGCAGTKVVKVTETKELPQEITKEVAERFEVRESTPSVTPAADVAVSQATLIKDEKAKKRKRPAPKKEGAEKKTVFVYPNRRPPRESVWVGERQVFDITYFGVSAGDFTLDILPHKFMNGRKVYHVKGTAVSSRVFSLFYRLNDTVESFIDYDGIFSHRFHLVLDESKQSRDSLELNDSEKAQTFFWNRWNHVERGYTETKEFAQVQPFSQDTLSALFYLRMQPLRDGDVVNIPVISEAKTWTGIVTVLRREMMESPLGRIQTIVLQPEAQFQGVLKKQGDSFIWLTDDDRRFLVRMEAKVKIGTVVASLKQVELGTHPESTNTPSAVQLPEVSNANSSQ